MLAVSSWEFPFYSSTPLPLNLKLEIFNGRNELRPYLNLKFKIYVKYFIPYRQTQRGEVHVIQ